MFDGHVISIILDLNSEFIQAVGLWDGKASRAIWRACRTSVATTCVVEMALNAVQHGYRGRDEHSQRRRDRAATGLRSPETW